MRDYHADPELLALQKEGEWPAQLSAADLLAYANLSAWELHEAAALMVNVTPRADILEKAAELKDRLPLARELYWWGKTIERALAAKRLDSPILPTELVLWAEWNIFDSEVSYPSYFHIDVWNAVLAADERHDREFYEAMTEKAEMAVKERDEKISELERLKVIGSTKVANTLRRLVYGVALEKFGYDRGSSLEKAAGDFYDYMKDTARVSIDETAIRNAIREGKSLERNKDLKRKARGRADFSD